MHTPSKVLAAGGRRCGDYNIVKEEILKAYQLVPEAYRQRFRGYSRGHDETFFVWSIFCLFSSIFLFTFIFIFNYQLCAQREIRSWDIVYQRRYIRCGKLFNSASCPVLSNTGYTYRLFFELSAI